MYEDRIIKDNLNKTATKVVCIDKTILIWFLSEKNINYIEIYQLIWIHYISK